MMWVLVSFLCAVGLNAFLKEDLITYVTYLLIFPYELYSVQASLNM